MTSVTRDSFTRYERCIQRRRGEGGGSSGLRRRWATYLHCSGCSSFAGSLSWREHQCAANLRSELQLRPCLYDVVWLLNVVQACRSLSGNRGIRSRFRFLPSLTLLRQIERPRYCSLWRSGRKTVLLARDPGKMQRPICKRHILEALQRSADQ